MLCLRLTCTVPMELGTDDRPLVLVVLHARAFFVSLPISLSIAESKVSGPSPFSNTTSANHFRDSGISSGKPLHITTGSFGCSTLIEYLRVIARPVGPSGAVRTV